MDLDTNVKQDLMRKLLLSRMRILNTHPFFGLLLMHMLYGVDDHTPTAYTDGERIVFGIDYLLSLSEKELDFVMMHEIMHVVLQHCFRGSQFDDPERFNIACDIVVNSNILLENNMKLSSISIKNGGVSMHIAPDGKEGHEYTAEQVYKMLPNSDSSTSPQSQPSWTSGRARQEKQEVSNVLSGFEDDHSHWCKIESDSTFRDIWVKNIQDAANAIEIRESVFSRGLFPAFAKRLLMELRKPQTDWRQILEEFVQKEIGDYSFNPPDRRMDESPFFLPDFNESESTADNPRNILFMIDTSGSMSDEMVAAAFSEIKGAVDQFDGTLEGWLGFFDAAIVRPVKFSGIDELARIEPAGGGGTDFQIIFEYVLEHMENELPSCIIILTDGYAPFPNEKLTHGIPVLWLINNDRVDPPWGKVARIQL